MSLFFIIHRTLRPMKQKKKLTIEEKLKQYPLRFYSERIK